MEHAALRAFPPCAMERGAAVRVVSDVKVKGSNAHGWVGAVVEDRAVESGEDWGACCELAWDEPTLVVQFGPTGYFAYEELTRVEGSGELTEGDRVLVVEDVPVKGFASAKGMQGTVTDVWEICATDPACCCAELATDAPLTVRLDGMLDGSSEGAGGSALPVGYFHTSEVREVKIL
jgi:uncharacterized Zn ribbon protein